MHFVFFGITDLLSFIGWLTLFVLAAFWIRYRNPEKEEFRYFLPHFFWKIGLGFAFGLVYMFYYERGGDTIFYWDGARKLNLLFFENPSAYFTELFRTPDQGVIPSYYNHTGIPPWWIYSESNSWFVCKVANFLSFFSFGSYITLNLFFSVIATTISWKFFQFIRSIVTIETKYVAFACLFIPSVGFWCTGLIKDTIAFGAILLLIMSFFKLYYRKYSRLLSWVIIFLSSVYFLYSIRPFLLLSCFIPFFILIIFKINSTKSFITRFITRIAGISFAIIAIGFYVRSENAFGEFSANSIVSTAEVIQKDLVNNTTYTGKKYDLGISEFTESNLITIAPAAIAVALFRPFVWEADSIFMLINGMENLIILFFTIRMFLDRRKTSSLREFIRTDFFLFSLLFILILGYFVGLTSGLFGTLVRLKAPILPFYLLLVFHKFKKDSSQEGINRVN
jgi:hypothetical protein